MDFSSTGATLYRIAYTPDIDLQSCKDECDEFIICSSVDLKPSSKGTGTDCWQYEYPYDPDKVQSDKGSHHIIDRSSKTAERCIGDYKGKWKCYILM